MVARGTAPGGSAPLPPAASLLSTALSSAPFYGCAAGDCCPFGSLCFFSIAGHGGGGTGSAAMGGWTLGKEAGSGILATAGKLLAA